MGQTDAMHISAKADYAVRALLVLATADGARLTVEQLVDSQELPRKFLESILGELRRAGLVTSRRGTEGGFTLSRPAATISVADVLRAVDGPLAEVRGLRPEQAVYRGPATHLGTVWIAARASLRSVLEQVSLADIADGALPAGITALTADPDTWLPH